LVLRFFGFSQFYNPSTQSSIKDTANPIKHAKNAIPITIGSTTKGGGVTKKDILLINQKATHMQPYVKAAISSTETTNFKKYFITNLFFIAFI